MMGDIGTSPLVDSGRPGRAFRHEALLYAGYDAFVAGTASFVRDGLAAGEPILVAVTSDKIALLRDELGADADAVEFADMAELGRNPGRIIPVWRDFVADRATGGRAVRGVGEPIWAARTAGELVECQQHESLLNLAFVDAPAWWLLCPYDTGRLPADVIAEAQRSHPFLFTAGQHTRSDRYGDSASGRPFDGPLPEPRQRPVELRFVADRLDSVRGFVAEHAACHGLRPSRIADLVLAAHEVAANSVRYGGGGGVLRIWPDGGAIVCEIRDGGRIADPLAGRRRPTPDQERGIGLWLVHQLCDLVQIRSSAAGTVVRLRMSGT